MKVIYTITLEGAEKHTEALVTKHLQALADDAGRIGVHSPGLDEERRGTVVLPTLKIDVEWVRRKRPAGTSTP